MPGRLSSRHLLYFGKFTDMEIIQITALYFLLKDPGQGMCIGSNLGGIILGGSQKILLPDPIGLKINDRDPFLIHERAIHNALEQ